MSDIRTSITLVDNLSAPARGMAAAMSATASECEKMKKTIGAVPDMSGYKAAGEQFKAMGDAERQASEAAAELKTSQTAAAAGAHAIANALEDQADRLRKSAQAAQAKAEAEQKAVTVYEQEYRAYEKNANELGVLTEAQKKSIDRYKEAYEEKKKAAEQAQNLADRLKTESEMADKAAQSARKEADAYGEVNTVTEKMGGSFGMAADSMSNLMMAAGGYKVLQLVKSAFESSASAAIEFESAITGVYKTVDGTPEQLKELSDATREMALSMPTDTTTIAGVMESAGQLGIATDSVADFSKTMIDLGNSTNLTAEQAASSLAKFANITGMSADNYSNLGSAIVDLGNNFATTEADIVDMSSYLSSAATLAGFAETDILGLSTAMSSVGINAEAGGSAMSQLITKMQTAVETGDASLEQFASIANMTSQQFQQAFGANAVDALQAFIMGLNDVERNGASASVILQDMGLDGIRLSNTVKALASSGGLLTNAVNTANTAWQENTALTNEADKRYSTLESKMTMLDNAANDLKISVGNSLTPAMSGLAGVSTDVLKGLSGFAQENQALTAGIMGTVGTLGAAVGGFTTLAPAITAVSSAYQAFDKTLSLSKIGLVVGGISLAVGAVAGLVTAFSDAKDEVEDYNGTLEECANEIAQVQGQYNSVVKVFGEQSEAARELEDRLNTLNAQYEKGGGAAADYTQRAQKHAEAIRTLSDGYQDQISKISSNQTFALTAAAQLQALSEKAVITNSDLDLMGQYADHLNNTFECDIKVNYDTGELTGFDPNDISQMALKAYEASKRQLAFEQISSPKFIDDYQNLYRESRNFDTTPKGQTTFGKIVNMTDVMAAGEANSQLEEYRKKVIRYYEDMGYAGADAVTEAENYLRTLQQGAYPETTVVDNGRDTSLNPEKYGEVSLKMSELSGTANEAGDAVADLSASIAEAKTAYNEMYAAAKESFEGQFGLFDEAQKSVDATVSKFEEAQQSQLEYWQSYSENISYLSQYSAEELGMSETAFTHFKELVASGSPEAAGLVASMRETIENEGIDAVRSVGETMSQVYDEQEKAVVNTAEWGSGLKNDASLAVKNAIDAANSAAKGFTDAGTVAMDNFALGIRAGIGNAINAAQEVANNIQSVLGSIRVNIPSHTVNSASDAALRLSGTYATGTLSAAPGLALVGENGPELVNFGGGEVVYTADQTRHMMQDMGNMTDVYIPQNINEAIGMKEPSYNGSWNTNGGGSQDRTITINIGGDTIRVEGNISRDDVCSILESKIKPVLMNVLSTEILEEGESSYEY